MNNTIYSTAPDHLNTIVNDIRKLINEKNDFVAFVVLMIGIEFLGSLIDAEDFEKERMSEIRFKNGLKLFSGKEGHWYNQNSDALYQLRCDLIHQYRPVDTFYLTSTGKSNAPKEEHKKMREGKIVLVIECFLVEFEKAIKNLEKKLPTLSRRKREEKYLSIKNIKAPKAQEEIKIEGKDIIEILPLVVTDSPLVGYTASGNTLPNNTNKV